MWVTQSCLQFSAQKEVPIWASPIHTSTCTHGRGCTRAAGGEGSCKEHESTEEGCAPLKRHKEHLQKQLKRSIADLRTQLQKRRRILKRAGNLDPEDLAWLQEQLRLKREAQEAEATTG